MIKIFPKNTDDYPYINGLQSKEWKDLSNEIRKRDNYKCQILRRATLEQCGWQTLNVHHIDLNTLNNDPDNLITLCEPHHQQLHEIYDSIYNNEKLSSMQVQFENTLELLLKNHCLTEVTLKIFYYYLTKKGV